MDEHKRTVLEVECDLFRRKLRTKERIRQVWKDDPEAVEYFKENLKSKPQDPHPTSSDVRQDLGYLS